MIPGRLETESAEYRRLRDELREAEIALKDQRERVAALRRKLPLDTEIQDYEFHEGPADPRKDGPFPMVRLSELFEDPRKPLVVYQYMFGGAQKRPCPSCTMWVDGFNGVAHHLRQTMNFAIRRPSWNPGIARVGKGAQLARVAIGVKPGPRLGLGADDGRNQNPRHRSAVPGLESSRHHAGRPRAVGPQAHLLIRGGSGKPY